MCQSIEGACSGSAVSTVHVREHMPAEACDSLAKFLEEGKIEFLQKAESHFEVATESSNRYRIIAVVGLFDKGAQFNTKHGN